MFKSWRNWLTGTFTFADRGPRFAGWRRGRRGATPSRHNRAQLAVEGLEERAVPTVAFTPHFSGTTEVAPSGSTIAAAHAKSLQSPPVVLIFTGSYWNTKQGLKDDATLTASMKLILGGPYLSGLTQYGSNGKATYFGTWADTRSTPALDLGNTPSGNTLLAFVRNEINHHKNGLPSGSGQHAPLYVVVNDPADSGSAAGTFGYNQADGNQHAAYIGAKFLPSGKLDKDTFTQVFSHELAEGLAAYVTVNDPGQFKAGSQIADNEPETGNGYTHRLADGNLVQAYWSQKDKAFIVPDGNQQTFTLTPLWNGHTFTGNYNLLVNGDQLGVNYNNDITIDRNPNTSGTRVTMNGESASFAQGTIKQLNVNTGGGFNTVNVQATTVPVSLVGHGTDTVNVGNAGSVQGIQGALTITNPPNVTTLNVDDSADPTPRTVTVGNGATSGFGVIDGLAPADISFKYADTAQVTIATGTGGNTVNVLATGVTTNLIGHGSDTVNIGDNGSVQGIWGALNITNPPSYTAINVDDSADPFAQNATLSQATINGDSHWEALSGLAPAAINYYDYDVSSVAILINSSSSVDVQDDGGIYTTVNGQQR